MKRRYICLSQLTVLLLLARFLSFPQKSSNPSYLRTVSFRSSDGLSLEKTEVRITAYDFREKLTATCIQLGKAAISLEELKSQGEWKWMGRES